MWRFAAGPVSYMRICNVTTFGITGGKVGLRMSALLKRDGPWRCVFALLGFCGFQGFRPNSSGEGLAQDSGRFWQDSVRDQPSQTAWSGQIML